MFKGRSSKFEVTEGDPIFEVRYLGCRETERAFGTDCTTASVSGLWLRCPYEKSLPKGYLQVGLAGVSLSLNGQIELHNIQNVSYCCVESTVNERIFAWIFRVPAGDEAKDSVSTKSSDKLELSVQNLSLSSEEDEEERSERRRLVLREDDVASRFMCHAVLASKPSRAQIMAATLRRAFQVAYKDWKRERSKDERTRIVKSLTERSLPATPTSGLPRASRSEADFRPNIRAETRSLGSANNGQASPLPQGEARFAFRDDTNDTWSLSGNE